MTKGLFKRKLVLFIFEMFAESDKKKILETEVLAKCLFEVKTSSAIKFDEHMREPYAHDLFQKATVGTELYIKSRLSKSQIEEILEGYGIKKSAKTVNK